MYSREDYLEALEERDKCAMNLEEWNFHQSKIQSIATALVAAGNTWMVQEIVDEVYSLFDCGAEITDKAVEFDIWMLESNGYEEKAKELRELFE